MPGWVWILIALAIVAVIALAVWAAYRKRRSERLRGTFGPEYDRVVRDGDRRSAESELEARQQRRAELDIRPLSSAARRRYSEGWRDAQAEFVDSPPAAVRRADGLVIELMGERGYPVDDFEERSAVVSVDHPVVVENYRAGHAISAATEGGKVSTEDLRQAMVHYRYLFEELLGEGEERARGTG